MKKMFKYIKGVLIILSLIALWTLLSTKSSPLFLPKPSAVWQDLVTLIHNGTLLKSTYDSFIRITLATLLSCLFSIPLGLLMFSSKIVDGIVSPIVNVLRYFPANAFYPLLILWLGIENKMKIVFLFLVTFVYFLPSIILCIKDVDSRLVDTGYTMGLSKFQVIRKIILPYSLPSILQNILMMYGMGWTYITIAEMVNTNSGLGYLINIGSARGRTDMVFASIITIIVISFLIDTFGSIVIKHTFSWKFLKQAEE